MKMLKPCALTIMIGVTGAFLSANAHAISQNQFLQSYNKASNVKSQHIPIVYQAEKNATLAGKVVLRQARLMALDKRTIVKGSCWDYLNSVFKEAGVKRKTIFKQSKRSGKYINVNKLKSGDWLYHINHSYHGVEHSGMFVGWADKSKGKALMLSYPGQNRKEPARYKVYDISSTYNVMRPQLLPSTKAGTMQATSKTLTNQKKPDLLVKDTLADVVLPIASSKLYASNNLPVRVVEGVYLSENQLTDPYYIKKKPFHIPTVEAVRELQPKLIQMPHSNNSRNIVKTPTQSVSTSKALARKIAKRKSIELENSVPTPDASVNIETTATIIDIPTVIIEPVIEAKVIETKQTVHTASKPNLNNNPATSKSVIADKKELKDFLKYYANAKNVKREYLPFMYKVEQTSTPAAQKVLGLGRVMSLDRREILQGTSRNYINAIFVRTGVDKEAVFKASYPKGPFIASEKIASGDWVSFINHSYKNVEHNGIFVGWVDRAKKKALILSYPGEGSRKPARYRVYDLRHVYEVKRPVL